jgi:hypothetical protein
MTTAPPRPIRHVHVVLTMPTHCRLWHLTRAHTETPAQIARMLTACTGVNVAEGDIVMRSDGYFVNHLDRQDALTVNLALIAAFEADPTSGIPSIHMRPRGDSVSVRLHVL